MIRVRGIQKTYAPQRGLLDVLRRPFQRPAGTHALKGVDLDVEAGEIFGVLGPNGAGKTTFLKILVNLVLPSAGEATLAGHDLVRDSIEVRRSVGYIPSDERSFFWRLSGRDNLRFFASLQEIPPGEAERRIDHYLERFGMGRYADQTFALYSSGQKKMFTIVRGLLPRPPILVFDEPTNSLDPPMAKQVMDHVTQLAAEGRTILWATHRLEEVREICSRVILIDRGETRFYGTVDEFASATADRSSGGELRPLMETFESLLKGD